MPPLLIEVAVVMGASAPHPPAREGPTEFGDLLDELWKALIVQRDLRGPDGLSTDGVAAAEMHCVLTALLTGT